MNGKLLKAFCLLFVLLCFAACVSEPAAIESPDLAPVEEEEASAVEELADEQEEAYDSAMEAGEVPMTVGDLRDVLLEAGEDLALLQYDVRYSFEQFFLPMQIFSYEAEVIADIRAGDVDNLREFILLLWEFASANVILIDMMESAEGVLPSIEEALELANERRYELGLGDEHIADVAIEEIDGDTVALIVQLLDMEMPWLSTYIGIAHNEEMGLLMFALERMQDFDRSGEALHVFCFIAADSRGSFDIMEGDREAFMEAIGEAMNGLIEPASVTQRNVLR